VVDESIITAVQRYLHTLCECGINVTYAVVFGSQVSGHHHSWSDIDVLVVSPCFDDTHQREDINLLWRIAARVDSRIEPIAIGARQFEEDDSSAIIEIARREGKIISLN